jgi:hypothetical protein
VATYDSVLIVGCRRSVSAAWSSCYLYVSESWTLESYLSLPFSLASGPPKCDVSHLVDPQSALCSSASVTRRYLVTFRHDIPLPGHIARSQRVTTSTQVRLRARCTLQNTSVELAVAAQQYTKKVEIPKEYQKFAKVFSEEESQRFPPRRSCDHAIEFKPGAPDAIECKIYPMTWVKDKALDVFINEQLEKGYIRPSKLQYASSFFFIRKKDGKLRPVQDYRKINTWTVRNQYPLPLIGDLIHDLGGTTIFTKFDIRQGYNNIQIKAGDEHKAAFKT